MPSQVLIIYFAYYLLIFHELQSFPIILILLLNVLINISNRTNRNLAL
jgi:hypothetical protein